jgi:hypothetical protein
MGSLGARVNGTPGLKGRGGIAVVMDFPALPSGEWLYRMRPVLRQALEAEGLV